jgi:hypothetical protein
MNKHSFASLFIVAMAASLGAACSSSSSGAATAQQACGDLAHAQCALMAQCDSVTMQSAWGGDVNACATELSTQCVNANSYPGTGATAASVEACASATSTASCTQYGLPIAGCSAPAGTLANGAPCSLGEQCAGGACHVTSVVTCGTCTQKTPPQAGTCTLDSDCAAGQVCTGTCVTPAGAGGACRPYGGLGQGQDGCQGTFYCAVSSSVTGTVSGTCTSLPGKGQPCAGQSFGTSSTTGCANGLVCTASAGSPNGATCDTPNYVALGASCAQTTAICKGGSCVGGVCVAYAAAGSPCGGLTAAACGYGLYCTPSGLCAQAAVQVTCGLATDGGTDGG